MPEAIYTGVGRLKVTSSGEKIPAGKVVDMPEAALDNEHVHALKDICGYERDDGTVCTRTAGWGTDNESGRCKTHMESE